MVLKKAPPHVEKEHPTYNISAEERKTIQSLKNNKQIIIKESYKGAAVVFMNRDFYVERAECIVGDSSAYEKINGDGDKKLMNFLSRFINNYADQLKNK